MLCGNCQHVCCLHLQDNRIRKREEWEGLIRKVQTVGCSKILLPVDHTTFHHISGDGYFQCFT